MKEFLRHRNNRWTHDGWALRVIGSDAPMVWSTCTTRKEARALKAEREALNPDLFRRLEVVKVKLRVEVVG